MFNNNDTSNRAIGCTVTECKHHCQDDQYCTLQKIQVGKCKSCANTADNTECASFEKK
ncbi:MAG: DUF1540 domain-containing protein [Firmicutes bacterium]|nr:DUF1540 domain-containing protein [Bacillota bacterium]